MTRRVCPNCLGPVCRKRACEHERERRPFAVCVAPLCGARGSDCYRCHAPFCDDHVEMHDCETESEEDAEDGDREAQVMRLRAALRTTRPEHKRERQRGPHASEPRGRSLVPCPPDRTDPTAAGCPAVVAAAQKLGDSLQSQAMEMLPKRSVEGWPGQEGKVPVAKFGAQAASWGHPSRLAGEVE